MLKIFLKFGKLSDSFPKFVCPLGEKFPAWASHSWSSPTRPRTVGKYEYCLLGFSLPSIIITITINEPWNTETHKTDRNPPITNQKPWPFEPVKVKFCFLRGPLRWLTAAKNAIVSWLSNFRIRMFVKSTVKIRSYIETWTQLEFSRVRQEVCWLVIG